MGNGIEFFQTVMGRQFFDGTMPNLVMALEKLAEKPQDFLHQTERVTT